MAVQSINEVLAEMESIMERSARQGNALGYFAGMYRMVTISVRDAAAEGKFEDNERMIRLVICFANRYLDGFKAFEAGRPLSRSWWEAFSAAQTNDKLILQHLFLGMNAHIHLDLGFSAASICPGPQIDSLKQDFLNINIILANLINEVQNRLSRVSPLMRWVDVLGRDWDEKMAGFSLVKARDTAWQVALTAAQLPPEELPAFEVLTDKRSSRIAQSIVQPPRRLRLFIRLGRLLESRDHMRVVQALWGQNA